jgi:hypothetical protein
MPSSHGLSIRSYRGEEPVAERVRYGGRDDAVLRLVLYNLWAWRCYRCHRPKDFNDIQIDHIIPKHVGAERVRELMDQYGLPSDFDLDAPGNLAPICSVCNGPRGKGKKEHLRPVVLDQLVRALELGPAVVEQVRGFGNSRRVAEHLLRASQTDLSDPDARQAFEEHAPAVTQKLALLDSEKVDFVSFSTTEVEIDEGSDLEVGLSLNSRGRVAALVLKSVCECAMEDVLREPVSETARARRLENKLSAALNCTICLRG